MIDELQLFTDEANIWKTCGSVKNSAGNLALHLAGGLNFLIGTQLGGTGYVRNRDAEFSAKGISRETLLNELRDVRMMIGKTLNVLPSSELNNVYPIFFDKDGATKGYVLMQLLLHLNYHLGQMNYLRRSLE